MPSQSVAAGDFVEMSFDLEHLPRIKRYIEEIIEQVSFKFSVGIGSSWCRFTIGEET